METSMKASRVAKVPRRSKTYGSARTCEEYGCSTRLSMYNKFDKCNQHKGVSFPRLRGHTKHLQDA
jgi:hypothetical protein